MKPGWEEKRFEDCLEKVVYTKKVKQKDFLDKGDYPIISQEQNFINGFWNNSSDLFVLKKPIIIFGDHTKVIKYIDFNFVLGADGVKILQPIDKLFPKYFFYFLQSIKFKNLGYARHYRLLKDLFIPLPPLPEQQRIVAILDQAFAAIAKAKENTEQNLHNARELFQSTLNKVFSNPDSVWGEKKLKDICLIRPPKSEVRQKLGDNDLVSFVPMEDLGICQKNFPISRSRPLKEVFGSYTYFAEEDVLLAKITPCFENGKLGIARNLTNNFGFGSSEYFVFRANEYLFNEYLFYFLSREKFRIEGARNMSGAVGHKRVAKDFIENYLISLPRFPEQRSIVFKLDNLTAEIQNLESIYKQILESLEELKKSLLHKAFAGELTQD